MSDGTQLTIVYRPFKKFEDFFEHGRPLIDPKRPRLYFSRKFDFLLILCIIASLILWLAHIAYVIVHRPIVPTPSNQVISQCAVYTGEWNSHETVLRYWSVPYAVPPIIGKEQLFQEVLNDIIEKHHLQSKDLRWHPTYSTGDDEYCFLTFDDRCTFQNARWFCNMHKPTNRKHACIELDYENNIKEGTSENCLHMDISTPPFSGKLLPVIIVLTGFKFIRNPINPLNEQETAYIPSDLAVVNSEAVWVNARYRLGPLGVFYDYDKLGKGGEKNVDVTYFLLHDLMAIMNWVQNNIDRYGGDKTKVTLLCHGSGATTALALIRLQSTLASSGWFQGVWLASGSVNWHFDQSQKNPEKFLPKAVLRKLCPGESNPMEYNSRLVQCLIKSNKLKTEDLMKLLHEFYDDKSILASALQLKNSDNSLWFMPSYMKREDEPINWNETILQEVFTQDYTTGKNSWFKGVVFSSMENEFNGLYGSDKYASVEASNDITQLENDLLTIGFNKSTLSQLSHRVNKKRGDILLNILSALKYTCPQAWLLNTWRNYTKLYLNATRFYHIYNTESPSSPYTKVPGALNSTARNNPFHGLDMLILTGNSDEYGLISPYYKSTLQNAFYNFIHYGTFDSNCEIQESFDGGKMQLGCSVNAHGIRRVQTDDPLDIICNHVNWTENFHKLALQE
ncbi:unnamed protein product [Trichobilharzia szidati]|nr:unnamed protein product [Trichobilharzia szidati]